MYSFAPTTEAEVKRAWDEISISFLKWSSDTISKTFTSLILLKECLFPDLLKYSEILLVLKTGDRQDITNYRPISLLRNIANVYEKIVHLRIYTNSFLESNSLLCPQHYGTQRGQNTL